GGTSKGSPGYLAIPPLLFSLFLFNLVLLVAGAPVGCRRNASIAWSRAVRARTRRIKRPYSKQPARRHWPPALTQKMFTFRQFPCHRRNPIGRFKVSQRFRAPSDGRGPGGTTKKPLECSGLG